ncbi:MAG: glycosyltransferase [Betaproteobacteria bacterium HGW-Betaproteobacteria-20]|nr:MAG: glycosyltransferase [Betaproteobacteria bacterium HGW-Betaproteobacteria-20]
MPHTHYLTALNFYRNGQLTQAESGFQQVIAMQANFADAHHMLGIICYQTNRAADAVRYIQQALAISPRNVDYLNNCGLALRANNQLEAAIKSFQQAVLLQPKDLDVQLNLGNTLLAIDRFEEAAGYYRRVLRAMPKNEDANKSDIKKSDISAALCHCLTSQGNQAHAIGNFIQAEASFNEALQFNPQDAALLYNLGNAQRELGKPADAAKQYLKAIQINPNDADTYNNLGNVQRESGQLDLAIVSYQQALKLNQNLHHAKVHLVHQKQHICYWQGLEDDIAEICHWVTTQPSAQISPFAFLAMPGTTAKEQLICANNWVNNRYAALVAHGRKLDFKYSPANKKIKIGYLSADFRLHPLAFLVSELIELHDRSQFEIIAFSYGVDDKSNARARLEKAFDQFHDIRHLSEIDAAKKINACNIDMLVDLTGFTQTSRSGIAALRPAPVNVNWLGFPGTMGALNDKPLFDYILTDSFISPAETANHYAEKLAILPHCYQPNDRKRPVSKTPLRAACGLPEGAFVFCCFNQTFKITPDVFAVWMRLLKAVPNSVLWLLDCNIWAKQNLIREATAQGVNEDKLIFAPRVAIADHLARHAHADLFLDTLPYNAHTTCSDALWMGLPVLTCAGNTFAARVAGSLLNAVNLTELITYNLQDYEKKALYLVNNSDNLLIIRQKLLADRMSLALFDTNEFVRSLEDIYQKMWERLL